MRAAGSKPRDSINRKQDALWEAVTARDAEEVGRLCDAEGVDVNFIAPDGWVRESGTGGRSLLHHAAWIGDLRIFKILVEHGADLCEPRQRNWARAKGFTPFHHACFYNRLPIVEYCLDQGADPNLIGEDGFTPLHLAAKFSYGQLAELLLARGGRTDIATRAGKTCWELAADESLRKMLRSATHNNIGAPLALPQSIPDAQLVGGRRELVNSQRTTSAVLTMATTSSAIGSHYRSTNDAQKQPTSSDARERPQVALIRRTQR